MGENHSRVARKLQKEILFCPAGGFHIFQDGNSRTRVSFSNRVTWQKTLTRSGVLMPNCLWPVASIYGSISTWPWDVHILLTPLKVTFQAQQLQPLLVFSYPDLVGVAQGSMSLKEVITCSSILLGPHCPKSQIFHCFLSRSQYFLRCSPLLTNILF